MKISLEGLHNKDAKSRGLSPEDHRLLSGADSFSEIKKANKDVLSALRKKYENDTLARQQIDTYDSDSSYSKAYAEYLQALAHQDQSRKEELENWFKVWYPEIHSD